MTLELVENGPVVRVSLVGRLDVNEVTAIETRFLALTVAPRKPVIVDLSQLSYLGSMGLGMLVSASQALARHGRKMVFLDATEFVERVMTVSGVAGSITLRRGLEEARRELGV